MGDVAHRIKTQTFELRVAERALAQRLLDDASRMQERRIVPILDRVCNTVAAPGALHRLGTVEVDLGQLPADDFEEALCARLEPALRHALAALIQAEEEGARAAGRTREVQSALELFACFARRGCVPWWADAKAPELLAHNIQFLVREAREALAELLVELSRDPAALLRIAGSYTDEILSELGALFVRDPGALRALPARIAGAVERGELHAGVTAARARIEAWQCLLRLAIRHRARTMPGGDGAITALRDEALVAIATALRAPYAELVALGLGEAGSKGEKPGSGAPPATPAASGAADIPSALADADELYVFDAGLCILWPFLTVFFEKLGLLEKRAFRDVAARHRAARLLAHVATGEVDSEELLLPFPKILCGIDPDAVIEPAEPLTEQEIESSADLLGAVIANAPILNDMSAAFFRRSFLLREGILTSPEGAWLLRVKRETYDVVLDRLPWSFDWATLPFMEAPLRVEWR